MKVTTLSAAVMLVLLAAYGCGNSNQEENAENTEKQESLSVLEGNWALHAYTVGDSVLTAGEEYLMCFNDSASTFNMATGCNAIDGGYAIDGDSIKFLDLLSTQMLCHDMTIEDAMKTDLPLVNNYAVETDSVTKLELKQDGAVKITFIKK